MVCGSSSWNQSGKVNLQRTPMHGRLLITSARSRSFCPSSIWYWRLSPAHSSSASWEDRRGLKRLLPLQATLPEERDTTEPRNNKQMLRDKTENHETEYLQTASVTVWGRIAFGGCSLSFLLKWDTVFHKTYREHKAILILTPKRSHFYHIYYNLTIAHYNP